MKLRLAMVGLVSFGAIGKLAFGHNRKHQDYKIFNDPIHGNIKVDAMCVKIIDTPEFQRLRSLKQLGTAYYVYPGAPHNRFEHSIGVYHLAGEFTRTLQQNQPELNITDDDILCVEIAGLCHDLGHGPFSHMFDQRFIPSVRKDTKWTHEDGSLAMLDHLISNNKDVKTFFEKFDPDGTNLMFIKELINPPKDDSVAKGYAYKGRTEEKQFLYEIVSNKRNGIDVDKWDYLARDTYMLGIKNNFDHKRYMLFARVIDVEGEGKQICMRDKEASNIYNMYNTRASLHRIACQHKVSTGIELMLLDALIKANDHILIRGKNGKLLKMSECIDDMEAYAKLNDTIVEAIRLSNDPKLQKSRAILADIHSRQIYKCVGDSTQRDGKKVQERDIPKIRRGIMDCMTSEDKRSGVRLEEEDIDIIIRKFDYGMKDAIGKEINPVKYVRFYRKGSPNEAFLMTKDLLSHVLPKKFEERVVGVYCKDSSNVKKHHVIKRCFEQWCAKSSMIKMEQPKIWLGTTDQPTETKETFLTSVLRCLFGA